MYVFRHTDWDARITVRMVKGDLLKFKTVLRWVVYLRDGNAVLRCGDSR